MAMVNDIVQALHNLGGRAHYSQIYDEYEIITGREMTPSLKASIMKTIEDHSSDSRNFKGSDDFFYSVYGLGQGWWGLR